MEPANIFPRYVELMALVYHEGRNVSRIFHLHAASTKTFGRLADLPPDEKQGWEKLIPAQQRVVANEEVTEAGVAKTAEAKFREDFGVSLDELHAMFEHVAWKRFPQYGGPKWASIAKAVIDLRDAIDNKDNAAAEKLLAEIPAMRHNAGTVEHKLSRLKARPSSKEAR